MVVTNVIRFDHQARPYYLGRIHCRKLIFTVAGWILFQVFKDGWFTFFMDMMIPMRALHGCYVIIEIIAVIGLFFAFWKKNEYFLFPAILFLVQSIITGFKEIAIAIWTLIYPSSSVLEWFGEQHRSAPFKNMFFYHGYRAPLKNVRFYSILTLCFASLLLIADVIMLIITIKFYKYYHDWRIARKNGGETIAYASRISDPSSLPQTQTVNVDN